MAAKMDDIMARIKVEDTVEIDGRRLRRLRRARKLTQERLAALAAPVSRGHVTNLERSRHVSVARDLAERLAAAVDGDLSQLLAVDDDELVRHAVPFALPSTRRAVGEAIEELIDAADLSEAEQELVAEHLVAQAAA